jgi:hypothetical protein
VLYLDGVGPDYRDLLPTHRRHREICRGCAEGGVRLLATMGCPCLIRSHQVIMGRRNGVLSGRVPVFDALQMKFVEIMVEVSRIGNPLPS